MVSGNIAMGAGLSSSSALVVAFAQAAVALNGLNVSAHDFVDLCGEGEWFVGSRGGSADHAAISTGKLGYVSRIGFFPFRIEGEFRFPPQLRLVIAHSGSMAVKSAGARDVFNQRVACYSLAELYLRKHWPPAAGIEHLRDLTPQRLEVSVAEVYRALSRLPVRPTRGQLRKLFSREDQETLDGIFATHASCSGYDLRGAAMFGISEILRSERMAEVMDRGDLALVGEFFKNSHDGDRVARFDENGASHRHVTRLTDAVLERLACEEADLAAQSGRYACSTEAIDHLVDIANATDGVVGAQLAGAGLGGCMMILVNQGSLETLLRKLRAQFYKPRGLTFNAQVVTPVEGAGPVAF